jgi:hypothetical protein
LRFSCRTFSHGHEHDLGEQAMLLAVFVADTNEKALTIPFGN